MAIDNGFNFNRDDLYNDRCGANIVGAAEVAIKHPEMVAESVTISDYMFGQVESYVQLDVAADNGRAYSLRISSKRDVVWLSGPDYFTDKRVIISTGKMLLGEILNAIEEITFGY